jgi:thiol-disulfide isomerase/thioredoxin
MIRSLMLVGNTLLVFASSSLAIAQIAIPSPERVVTSAEEARGLRLYPATGLIGEDGRRIPQNQFDSTLTSRAKQWIIALQSRPVTGIQLDPLGRIAIASGQDALARQQFEARLATRGLSVDDRAYTLSLATHLFGRDAKNPARMRTALAYLAALDRLPARVIPAKFYAHVAIAQSYYVVGDGLQVRTHLSTAFAGVPAIPFERRNWRSIGDAFLLLANVLSGLPDGRVQIDSIGGWLHSYTQAPPALLANDNDSVYYWNSRANAREFQEILQQTNYLGRSAPAIQAQYWWNTSHFTTDSLSINARNGQSTSTGVKALNDGKIRVMEYGNYGCGACQAALPRIDQMRKTFPGNVEMWYVTFASDVWGAVRCTPDDVAQHLKRYYLEVKQLGLPIALWIGPRQPDIDGGTLNQENPLFTALSIRAYPTFVITDGKGLVRHISLGFSEPVITATVQYLIGETARATAKSLPEVMLPKSGIVSATTTVR